MKDNENLRFHTKKIMKKHKEEKKNRLPSLDWLFGR